VAREPATLSTDRYHEETRAVDALVRAMRYKLAKNRAKGSWQGMPVGKMIAMLRAEVDELEESAMRSHEYQVVLEEAADVANFAMMIADLARERK
jgi:hypothetical protein